MPAHLGSTFTRNERTNQPTNKTFRFAKLCVCKKSTLSFPPLHYSAHSANQANVCAKRKALPAPPPTRTLHPAPRGGRPSLPLGQGRGLERAEHGQAGGSSGVRSELRCQGWSGSPASRVAALCSERNHPRPILRSRTCDVR